ncbi:MAG: 16S rRNA (cytosine(1402)-N(4))-methyltransferase RsmH [Chitinispirillaceae bacterium]|jgi:16S rRNA (cytosine1402-N4)-methyltransferase|nr:16S rRNA (cytosine(1402)-N(4))-methyltransferase RsmH [Chitinispirillaceae bacterium]
MNSSEENSPAPHRRRVRYRGTHPRKYEEKYKELDPDNFSDDIRKVLGRRQTPAGMHRSICTPEILSILNPKPGELFLDATLGYGGHAQEIVPKLLPDGRLFGIDVDPIELPRTEARLRKAGFTSDNLIIRKLNFAAIGSLLPETRGGFDGILADLGVSSMQLDTPCRGFSYKSDGPLDLRLNPERGLPAAKFIETVSEKDLSKLLTENADEPHAALIAKTIKNSLKKISRTKELAACIHAGISGIVKDSGVIKKTVQRTFMALRIAVNDEFGVLNRFLDFLPWCLNPSGRVAILTFHSGEEKRVLKAFEKGTIDGVYSAVSCKPIRPSQAEQASNPRSSCARLHWAVRNG